MTALVSESGAGWGPAEATLLPNTAAGVQDKHIEHQSHTLATAPSRQRHEKQVTPTPKRQSLQEGLQASKQKQYSPSCLQSHINVSTLWAPTLLSTVTQNTSWPSRFGCCPAELVVKIGLWETHGHPTRFCFWMLPLFSEKPKPSQSLLHAWAHWCAVVPTAAALGLLGQLVQVRWPCSDPYVQVLCTAWVEIQGLAALGDGNQGPSVVLRQHYRYNTWVRHLWQHCGQWGEHKAACKTSSGAAHMHVQLGMVVL